MCQLLPPLLGCLLAISSTVSRAQPSPQQAEVSQRFSEDVQSSPTQCPPCAPLFSKLRVYNGRHVQNIKLMERGEPKSGTGFMFEGAGGALIHTCNYLNAAFGAHSCSVSPSYVDIQRKGGGADFLLLRLADDRHLTC